MVPTKIREGLAALEKLDSVIVRRNPRKEEDGSRWVLPVRIQLADLPVDTQIPEETDWFVLLADTYPWGRIRIYPAVDNGISATFPHQRQNKLSDLSNPWRTGNICVTRYGHILGRSGAVAEPTAPDERLLWHMKRAVAWVEAAARSELQQPGETYEVPEFDTGSTSEYQLAFNETYDSFDIWEHVDGDWGTVELQRLETPSKTLATGEFRDQDGNVIYSPQWGEYLKTWTDAESTAAWILLNAPPFEPPYDAPKTWEELEDILDGTPIDLYDVMAKVSRNVEEERVQILLVGFPIPETIGDPPILTRWQGVKLPRLKPPTDHTGGYRNTDRNRRILSRMELLDAEIRWLDSTNWAREQLSRRGAISNSISNKNVLLIGAGALGSTIAECLVRAGVQDITIVDKERFEIGNLARHTLSLHDVEEMKATALARRLRSLSPHVRAEALSEAFPPDDRSVDAVTSAEIVIDCTASDAVLEALRRFPWQHSVLFSSASLGRRGNRLFFFAADATIFPHETFREEMEPWLLQERLEWESDDAVPERVGCWHPASVVRMDTVAMWAGIVPRLLERAIALGHGQSELTVLETSAHGELPLVSEADPPFQDVIEWTSSESPLTVKIPPAELAAAEDLCRKAGDVETGGILAGVYPSETDALVMSTTDPPRDSQHSPTTFHRGTEGVDEWLREARESKGIHYLGEWHYHPSAAPVASQQDRNRMDAIATNEDYHCPDPVLVIIGGKPSDGFETNVYVFHREGTVDTLHQTDRDYKNVKDAGEKSATSMASEQEE